MIENFLDAARLTILISGGKNAGLFLRQGVTLVGLNTPTFLAALDAIDEIYGVFGRTLPEGSLEPANSIVRPENSLEVSNRLLTPKDDVFNMKVMTPTSEIDKHNVLKEIISEGRFEYCEDNEVQYFDCKMGESGKRR